jgi:nicotinamide-nucleotide amidase
MADIEIICIGNELLIGKIQNTNAYWLSKQATQLGVIVQRVTVIRDVVEEIAKTILQTAERKPPFIITTGGLGPTFDDKTLEGIAKALNCPLKVNEEALEMVKEKSLAYLKKHGVTTFELTKPRVKMATLPVEATPVNNPFGTAPAVRVNLNGTVLFALPGVPSEVEAIFTQTIAPLLIQAAKGAGFFEKSLFVQGISESALAPLIDRAMADNKNVYIKSHPTGYLGNKPHIELHLTITSTSEQNAKGILDRSAEQISSLIVENGGKVSC